MKNVLARHALRYFAAMQVGPLVILQGVWIILATATWSHEYGADSGVGAVMETLMQAYTWLGGVDEDGHGDENSMLAVWAKLSIVFYLIDAALRALRGPRPVQRRRSVWFWGGLSGLVTVFLMCFALWPTPDSLIHLTWLMLLFPTLSAGAAVWAVFTRRLVEDWTMPETKVHPGKSPAA